MSQSLRSRDAETVSNHLTTDNSKAKCFASDMAVAQTANAVQVFGGSGYIRGFEVERLYRDPKITQSYEAPTRSSARSLRGN